MKVSIKVPKDLDHPKNEWERVLVDVDRLKELLYSKEKKEKEIKSDRIFPVKEKIKKVV